MATPELNKFKKFIDHNVEIGNISDNASLELISLFSQNDLEENYEIIDKAIKTDIEGIDYQDLGEFLHEYHIYQEQIEEENGIPKLEKQNFHIEDINKWDPIIIGNGINVLENPQKDIIEFMDGKLEGKQLFKPEALLREVKKAGENLPETPETYQKIIKEKYNGDYEEFIDKENIDFVGSFSLANGELEGVNQKYYLLCDNGEYFYGDKEFSYKRTNGNYYISGRCIQE